MNGGSIDAAAEEAVRTLTSLEPKLELGGQPLQFSAHKEQVRSSAGVPLSSTLTVKQDRLSLKVHMGMCSPRSAWQFMTCPSPSASRVSGALSANSFTWENSL